MQEPANGTQFARFGAFEVNFACGELRKHGIRLKVQEQPFQVLELLLARPGELVTRETIQQKLWPSGTFVDFENGLNTAINRLREALGDSAENPRFIVTEPRRGYRFIAPVDGRFRLDDSRSVLEKLLLLGSSFKRSLMALMVTAAALAAVGIFYIHRAPKLAGNHSIIAAGGLSTKVGRLEEQFSKIGRLTVLTNRPDGVRDLVAYLSGYGAECSTLNTSELGKIAATVPDIIIVAADTRDSWTEQPQSALRRQVFANYKVFGMGDGGAQLFSVLGLQIGRGHVMTASRLDYPLIVELKALSLSSSDKVLQVSQGEGESIGVYDEGSPDIAGFEGIARWQNAEHAEHHWPIARQGNYMLWGFDSPVEQMTEVGKRLLVNLLIEQRMHPSVPLSQARTKHEYVQPGLLAGRLNAQFPTSLWHFQVRKPGRITARLSWNPAELPLALILNGPGQSQGGYFARKDGISPLEIAFDATDGHVSTDIDWRISIDDFGETGGTLIDYKLELSYFHCGVIAVGI
jgi:DNA-binding winged helix-turn-helix (wHTH) protein